MRLPHVIQWAVVAALVTAGLAAEAAGHSELSWLADGLAVAVWLLFRLARRRLAR